MTQPASIASALRHAQRPVIKVGSALIDAGGGDGIDLAGLIGDALDRFGPDAALTFVTSGAVALGHRQSDVAGDSLAGKQALSAIGQIELMARWQTAAARHHRAAAQILLTPHTTARRRHYLNARATLRALHEKRALPVVNENDAVATEELRYGDNDRLAAMTAGLVGADLLILLTDVDGLYTANPHTDPDAQPIDVVSWAALTALDRAEMGPTSTVGTGGMASKIDAARLAGSWGIPTLIINGKASSPLAAVTAGATRCTLITPNDAPMTARRRWLTGLSETRHRVTVDAGAATALESGASLLAVGVTNVDGPFAAGDVVGIMGPGDEPLGFGLARLDSDAIKGQTDHVVIHRNDLVIEAPATTS